MHPGPSVGLAEVQYERLRKRPQARQEVQDGRHDTARYTSAVPSAQSCSAVSCRIPQQQSSSHGARDCGRENFYNRFNMPVVKAWLESQEKARDVAKAPATGGEAAAVPATAMVSTQLYLFGTYVVPWHGLTGRRRFCRVDHQ